MHKVWGRNTLSSFGLDFVASRSGTSSFNPSRPLLILPLSSFSSRWTSHSFHLFEQPQSLQTRSQPGHVIEQPSLTGCNLRRPGATFPAVMGRQGVWGESLGRWLARLGQFTLDRIDLSRLTLPQAASTDLCNISPWAIYRCTSKRAIHPSLPEKRSFCNPPCHYASVHVQWLFDRLKGIVPTIRPLLHNTRRDQLLCLERMLFSPLCPSLNELRPFFQARANLPFDI